MDALDLRIEWLNTTISCCQANEQEVPEWVIFQLKELHKQKGETLMFLGVPI